MKSQSVPTKDHTCIMYMYQPKTTLASCTNQRTHLYHVPTKDHTCIMYQPKTTLVSCSYQPKTTLVSCTNQRPHLHHVPTKDHTCIMYQPKTTLVPIHSEKNYFAKVHLQFIQYENFSEHILYEIDCSNI